MKTAVILAAGEGRGAWPYCGIRQKVTLPIANVPMVRRLALDLAAIGVTRQVVVTGHRSEAVRACLGDLEGIRFVDQKSNNGPVHAALCGLQAVETDDVLIACADCITSTDSLTRLIAAYDEGNAPVALVAPAGNTTAHYTTIESDSRGLVTAVQGRGERSQPRFAGFMVAKAGQLKHNYERDPGIMTNAGIGAMPPLEGDLALCLDAMHKAGIPVRSITANDFFVDVDRPWHLLMANRAVLNHTFDSMTGIELGEGASIHDGADVAEGAKLKLGPRARIGKGCRIGGNAILEEGSSIINGAILRGGNYIGARTRCEDYGLVGHNTVLGNECVVSHCAEFNGLCFDTVYFYHYCSISGIMGTAVDIGAASVCGTWRFDNAIREHDVCGHREIPEAYGEKTYIGDYCRTGVNAIFMPGVKVGYYSCVGPGVIVKEDVPERTLLLTKQEHITKPWGPERYGW
ncbi:MAG: hypothetical protein AMXMBFR84_35060 [Candidatus Hydrogenedentota bacterium]